ncbi:terminase large subunit domain-containing protein [Sporosarcina aquimarina]|uniref:terminase large subunit domain-containing protein n=1 Tax=Sporosarcina aquimarina TaxID=114975 RepID=UPI001C8D8CB3|nr:terminase family protein [Sporosarcina aquimarina]MBY0221958.1 DNA packaging protein [Sporosarcina aquimarina]
MTKKKLLTPQQKIKMIFDDFELFAKNFLFITDNNNDVIPFEINEAQKDIEKLMKTNRFIVVGKARQSGISTFVLGRALWRALTMENENIIIISYKSDSAKSLFDTLKRINDYIPRERYKGLFPSVKRDNRGELLFSNGSKISSVTAGSKSVGRGSTYTYIHCSEFAFWQSQEQQLLSLEQSLAKGANSQCTIETTSNGTGNHFFKLYTAAMKGESKYIPVFIPFYHKLYKKQFKYDHEQAMEFYKSTNKGKRMSKEDLDDEELSLFEAGANLNMLAWRRWKIMDMESVEQFYQEYPANAMQSFISTGNSVFDQSKVLSRMSNTIEPLSREDVIQGIVDFPEYLVKFIGKGLDIIHLPVPNMRYWGGADVASGGGGNTDSSTLTILDSDGQEVLHFTSNKVPVYEFAEILNDLGRIYGYAFLCVERNSYGLPCIERLRKDHEYMNLYKQKIFNERGVRSTQIGLTTSQKTKAIFVSDFKESFEKGLINIDSQQTLQQMQLFVESEGGKTGNKRGNSSLHHDDSVISACLAVQAMKMNKYYVD